MTPLSMPYNPHGIPFKLRSHTYSRQIFRIRWFGAKSPNTKDRLNQNKAVEHTRTIKVIILTES